jgi:hypothetical protein
VLILVTAAERVRHKAKVCALRQDWADDVAGYICQTEVAALKFVGQLGVIDAQAMEDRGVKVVDVDGVFHYVIAEVVGLAMGKAALDAATGHPNGKAARMVITAVVSLG